MQLWSTLFYSLASSYATGPCVLHSLLRPFMFSGPQSLGRLVCDCLKSQTPRCFALCSANSRTMLTKSSSPRLWSMQRPCGLCKLLLCPRKPAQQIFALFKNHSALHNQWQLHSAAIGLQPAPASVTHLKTPSAAFKDFAFLTHAISHMAQQTATQTSTACRNPQHPDNGMVRSHMVTDSECIDMCYCWYANCQNRASFRELHRTVCT